MKDRLGKFSFVVANYLALEERAVDCLSFLPYTEYNRRVVSPHFVPMILDACSLIDSVLRDFINSPQERRGLKGYVGQVEEHLALGNAFSMFLKTDIEFLNPFANWNARVPTWWSAYNRLKHDRLNQYSAATYENVFLALCALHQVIARNREFIPNLISAGWFNSQNSYFGELVAGQYIAIGVKPIHVIPVETKLFVTPLHSNFVEFKDGQAVVSEDCEFGPRVAAIVSAMECVIAGEYQ